MARKTPSFGRTLRARRIAKGFSLRQFAGLNGVSPTYLSQVEQENIDPPTAERVAKIADLLDVNSDEWIALAGRVPEDLPAIIQSHPIRIPALIREVCDLSEDQLQELIDEVRKKKR